MSKEQYHLQLFMTRVFNMRELQKQYFAGDRKVFNEAKKAEASVDKAIIKLCSELGYSMTEINKVVQPKLL